MNRTIPFTTEGKESAGSEHGRSTPGDLRDNAAAPRLIACLLLVPEDAHAILSFLQRLAVSGRDRSPDKPTIDGTIPARGSPEGDRNCCEAHLVAVLYVARFISSLFRVSGNV
jgi:hypothetical protein